MVERMFIKEIRERVSNFEEEMVSFLRDMIRLPSESCEEEAVIMRIKEEMERLVFDEVTIDPLGNILGRIGTGPRVIAFDAHIDTVGVGDREEWSWDPYRGKVEDGIIFGRGASDQKGAMASMVYGAKVIKDLSLHQDFSLYFVGSIQEEDCDGLCWQYIINEGGLKPELVVITEPTDLNIYLGHRGRMEMEVTTEGISCHGSAPERGENSLYKMAAIIQGIERLNERLANDNFLGKGTIAVTHIYNETPSLCAIPNKTRIHLDRRLTRGEDRELAIREVEELMKEVGVEGSVQLLEYCRPSYRGLVYKTEKYYPTWVLDRDHHGVKAMAEAYRDLFQEEPIIDKWTFSTNGVSIMGRNRIPCIGFGPGNEIHAHTVNDQVPIKDLLHAAALYALFPMYLSFHKKREDEVI